MSTASDTRRLSWLVAESWNSEEARAERRMRELLDERRMRELLALGGIPTRIRTRRSVAANTAKAAPRRFLLPEVDPATMKATGGWREFVEVKQ